MDIYELSDLVGEIDDDSGSDYPITLMMLSGLEIKIKDINVDHKQQTTTVIFEEQK